MEAQKCGRPGVETAPSHPIPSDKEALPQRSVIELHGIVKWIKTNHMYCIYLGKKMRMYCPSLVRHSHNSRDVNLVLLAERRKVHLRPRKINASSALEHRAATAVHTTPAGDSSNGNTQGKNRGCPSCRATHANKNAPAFRMRTLSVLTHKSELHFHFAMTKALDGSR